MEVNHNDDTNEVEEEGRHRGDGKTSAQRSPSPSVARVVEVPPDQFCTIRDLGFETFVAI